MEENKGTDPENSFQDQEKLQSRIRFSPQQYQPTGQTTASIIAGIKPLPPGILDRAKKDSQEKEKEQKPVFNLYNVPRMAMTPTIKTKQKGGKIVTDKGKVEKTEKQKQQATPLQMTTSISGQSLMFQKPVLKKPAVFMSTEEKKPDAFTPSDGEKFVQKEQDEPKKPSMSLSILKYISVSVKSRRLIYEKDNFNNFFDRIEEYLSLPEEGDLKNEILENIENHKKILTSEKVKLEGKDLPPEANEDFKEAKNILIRAIKGFLDCIDDFEIVMEEKDGDVLDDCRELIGKAFQDMDCYFELREDIKSEITSGN